MEILEFADGWATGGVWAALIATALVGLCALGTLILAITDRGGLRRGMSIATVVLGACVALGITWLGDRLARFDSLVVEADGGWRLENALGIAVHVLAPDALRAVDFRREHVSQSRMHLTRGWVEIERPDGRRFRSAVAPIEAQQSARARLKALRGGR